MRRARQPDSPTGRGTSQLIGTWAYTYPEGVQEGYSFKADGTFESFYVDSGLRSVGRGTWAEGSENGSTIVTFNREDGGQTTWYYEIRSNLLYGGMDKAGLTKAIEDRFGYARQ